MQFRIYPQLPASDLARAQAWYSEKLGLDPVEPGEELFYDTGTAQFGIYPSDNAGTNKATAARLVVDDFDSVRAELLSRGLSSRIMTSVRISELWTGSFIRPTERRLLGSRTLRATSLPSDHPSERATAQMRRGFG